MLSRNRASTTPDPASEPAQPPEPQPAQNPAATGKGRPTPKRSQAEAARRRPLVPADRKAAARAQREASKAARDKQYAAMQSGDERYLPARDKGPEKRWVRDYVDARWNVGEFLLPVALVMAFATFFTTRNAALTNVIVNTTLLIGLISFADAFLLTRLVKRGLVKRFGHAPKGTASYAALRAFQMRRTRLPRPQVARGQAPR